MAFQQLQAARHPRRRNQEPAVHLFTRESRKSPEHVETRLRLTLPLLKLLGWSENQRLDVMVGVDEDEGKIQVAPNASGVFRLRRLSTSGTSFVLTSRVIPVPAGIDKKVQFSVEEGTILIDFA